MKRVFLLIFLYLSLSGCATVTYPPSEIGKTTTPGIYHEVRSGQTLWGISRIYDIDLVKIIKANRLPDASKIEVGQLIFVPGASEKNTRRVQSKRTQSEGFIWPVKGSVVSYFGSMKDMVKNKGIDIQTNQGVDVVASRKGKVTFTSENLKGYGKTIILDHLDGFQTVYAHNSQNFVKIDQSVKQGEVIAKVGNTGRAERPTLHFEIRRKHKPQNPFYYLP